MLPLFAPLFRNRACDYSPHYDHADIFAKTDPTQYQIALDILNSAKEYWEANKHPVNPSIGVNPDSDN